MKKLSISICSFALIAFLISCGDKTPLESRPAIINISFAGIPAENVNFDQANSRITVKLPAVLDGGLRPVIALTEGTRILSGLLADNTIDISSYCGCGNNKENLTLRVGDDKTTSTYELKIVPTGVTKPLETADQMTFSRKTKMMELRLPVENLYTNTQFNTLHLTNLATGNSSVIRADYACISGCSATEPNKIIVRLGTPIEAHVTPGTYAIGLNDLNFSQKLIVTE